MKKKVSHILAYAGRQSTKLAGLPGSLVSRIKSLHTADKKFDVSFIYNYTIIFLVFFSLLAVPAIHSLASINESSMELIQTDGTIDFDTKEKYENESQDEKIEFHVSRSSDDTYKGSNLTNYFAVRGFVSHFKNDIHIPPPELC